MELLSIEGNWGISARVSLVSDCDAPVISGDVFRGYAPVPEDVDEADEARMCADFSTSPSTFSFFSSSGEHTSTQPIRLV